MFGRATIRLGIGPHSSYYYTKIEEALIKGWRPAPQTLVNNKTQLGIERVQTCSPLLANILRSRYNIPGSGNDVVADNVAHAAGARRFYRW